MASRYQRLRKRLILAASSRKIKESRATVSSWSRGEAVATVPVGPSRSLAAIHVFLADNFAE